MSKNQIIWGGNYFGLPPNRCFIVWEKLTISEGFTMAMCEYAWTSFSDRNAKLYRAAPQGTKKEPRIHPTQKPVGLYAFCLRHFANKGDKILDTHAGSASCSVACREHGYDCWAWEKDAVYYAMAKKRLDGTVQQMSMLE